MMVTTCNYVHIDAFWPYVCTYAKKGDYVVSFNAQKNKKSEQTERKEEGKKKMTHM